MSDTGPDEPALTGEDPGLMGEQPHGEEIETASRGIVVTRARRHRRRGRALIVLLLVLALPALAAAGGVAWFTHRLDGGTGGRAVVVTIREHASTNAIADLLESKGVIDSTLAFRLYTRVFHHSKLRSGDYTLRAHMGVRAAVRALETAPKPLDRLVLRVVPGLWLNEVADQVHTQLHLSAARFKYIVLAGAVRSKYQPADMVSTEGLLFPDTYFFTPRSTEIDVVRTMVRRFDEIASSVGLASASRAIGRSPYDVVKVAALIQGEVKFENERPLVASVIYNRLARNMLLNIDAQVLYANNTHSTKNFTQLRSIDSPYNSYKYPGLGPTPIATVTKASLLAALRPAQTTYLYYVVADAAGHQAFASTQAEHDRNVAKADGLGLLG